MSSNLARIKNQHASDGMQNAADTNNECKCRPDRERGGPRSAPPPPPPPPPPTISRMELCTEEEEGDGGEE